MGCDNVLESGAQRDSCGVCNGDDGSATRVNDTLIGSGGFGYHTVAVIPAGARDIRIAEATANSYVYLGKFFAHVSMYIIYYEVMHLYFCSTSKSGTSYFKW